MEHESRDFHAVLFHTAGVRSMDSLCAMFPRRQVSRFKEVPCGEHGHCDVKHCLVYSPQPFTYFPERALERRAEKLDDMYQHDLYLLGMPIKGRYFGMIVVPYAALAKDVLRIIRIAPAGRELEYYRVNLDGLLAAVYRGIGAKNETFRLNKIQMQIEGESDARIIMLAGPDVCHSAAFSSIKAAIATEGLSSLLRRCRIAHEAEGVSRICMEADRFGRFSFRVRSGGGNLYRVPQLFERLFSERLMESHTLMTSLLANDEEE